MERIHLAQTTSTMDVAKQFVIEHSDAVYVTADVQTAGRGRRGSSWLSPIGGLYASFGNRYAKNSDFSGLSLAVGVAIIDALKLGEYSIGLKWPNDIVHRLSKKKLAGILIESSIAADGSQILIIGIGMNLLPLSGAADDVNALSLSDLIVPAPEKQFVIDALASAVPAAVHEIAHRGFAAYHPRWQANAVHDGIMKVTQDDREVHGTYRGIGNDGALLLDQDGVIERVVSGHVTQW